MATGQACRDVAVRREPAPMALSADVEALLDRALLYVTGKGGAGKTTVAGALGLAAAARGCRTLVCDLAASHQLARAFGQAPDADGEVRLTGDLWSLSVDPQDALEEWLRRQPGGPAAVAVLKRSHAFAGFVAAAPGAKELVTIGKVIDFARPDPRAGTPPPYDRVIVDGPSTGHALGMLAAPGTMGEVARIGRVGAQARELRDFLGDADSIAYVGVSLPEELSVNELSELEQGLPDAVGRGLDLIVVNGVYPDRFSDEDAQRLEVAAQRNPAAWALRAALAQHRRARIQADLVGRLRRRAQAPVITLPFLFVPAIGPPEYDALARALVAGPAPE
jgi:anion-transporting  ArsA/GET3 family ATPase